MGLMLAEPGFHTRCFVEWDEYPRSSLIAAQRAGYFVPAPIWDDVTTFDARPFAGAFDTLIAGYPCQPFSQAGQRRGDKDERHLWPDIARIIGELGPGLEWIFLENVAGHVTLGLETVLRDLWDMGFTPAAGLFSAGETGAPHERQRIFIVAYRPRQREREPHDPAGTEPRERTRGSSGGRGLRYDGELADATCVGRGIHEGQRPEGSRAPDPGRSIDELAYPDGRNPRPERQQRGGQQRLHQEGGSDTDDMGHATGLGRGEGRPEPEFRRGRDTSAGSSSDVDGATGARRFSERFGAGSDLEGGERLSCAGCDELADTGRGPGHKRRAGFSGSRAETGREGETTRAFRSRAPVFPPGPSDAAAWALVLHGSPHLAPALGRQGIVRASFTRAAQLLAADAEATAQSGPGGMAGSDALPALGGSAGGLLDPGAIEPFIRRMADGLASRPRALRLLGNGVFPLAAAYAWRTLGAAHGLRPVDLETTGEGCGEAGADGVIRGDLG